jgi:hypothetical protein
VIRRSPHDCIVSAGASVPGYRFSGKALVPVSGRARGNYFWKFRLA